ncbi:hypothetical protein BHE74_00013529 [Ensete ventricosum]|nr:hypothetical protein BHE74_00013529 [Ensete ventricosum]
MKEQKDLIRLHQRSPGADVGAPGQEVAADKGLEYAGLAAALASDDGHLGEVNGGGVPKLGEDVLKLVHDRDHGVPDRPHSRGRGRAGRGGAVHRPIVLRRPGRGLGHVETRGFRENPKRSGATGERFSRWHREEAEKSRKATPSMEPRSRNTGGTMGNLSFLGAPTREENQDRPIPIRPRHLQIGTRKLKREAVARGHAPEESGGRGRVWGLTKGVPRFEP